MNLFELGFFMAMVSVVMLCSRVIGRLTAIPEILAVLPIIGIIVLVLRIFTRIRPHALFYLAALLAAVSLVSVGLAKALDLRESIFMTPVSAGLTLMVIRSTQLAKRRLIQITAHKSENR